MASTTIRRPFAPLDEARLQTLTSVKNKQNAILSSAVKRKAAESPALDDSENVDPAFFAKRSKSNDGFSPVKSSLKKLLFTAPAPKAAPVSCEPAQLAPSTSRPRAILKPKAPSIKANANAVRRTLSAFSSNDLSARSSGRGGILSTKRRTTSSFARRDTSSKLASAVPFSLDAALKGTISAYASALPKPAPAPTLDTTLDKSEMESSWFFNIHEDTPEQEMTNLLQHSTCVLDISSDEETEQKARHARAEGRDKENIPPANDVSQTSRPRPEPTDSMVVEMARNPLSQLNAADFYEIGCDETSIVLVPGDESEENGPETAVSCADNATVPPAKTADTQSVEELMGCRDEPAASAAVLRPIEGSGESFEVWESGSSKEDGDQA